MHASSDRVGGEAPLEPNGGNGTSNDDRMTMGSLPGGIPLPISGSVHVCLGVMPRML